jgi:hypothetical protein
LINTTRRYGDFPQRNELMASPNHKGYSLLEMMLTVSIALTMAAVTFVAIRPMLNQSHTTSAYDTTLTALRNTRNLAITQSHEYYVIFTPSGAGVPATILVQYQPPAVGAGPAPPLENVISYTLPTDVNFAVQAGFPAATPDGFGTGVTAIDFESTAGVPLPCNCVVFYPDGSAQDTVGNYNSGIIYLSRPADAISADSARAITVWGATGRIRGWGLSTVAGVATWVQQ